MIDISQAVSRYFPSTPIVVAVISTSTAWQVINSTPFESYFIFDCDVDCYAVVGPSDVGAASSTSWRLPAGVQQDFAVKPGYGVRVIRAGSVDGTLKIASTGA